MNKTILLSSLLILSAACAPAEDEAYYGDSDKQDTESSLAFETDSPDNQFGIERWTVTGIPVAAVDGSEPAQQREVFRITGYNDSGINTTFVIENDGKSITFIDDGIFNTETTSWSVGTPPPASLNSTGYSGILGLYKEDFGIHQLRHAVIQDTCEQWMSSAEQDEELRNKIAANAPTNLGTTTALECGLCTALVGGCGLGGIVLTGGSIVSGGLATGLAFVFGGACTVSIDESCTRCSELFSDYDSGVAAMSSTCIGDASAVRLFVDSLEKS